VVASIVQVARELVSVKVFVRIEDMANKHASRLSQFFAPDFEKLAEFLDWRIRNLERRQ
jgi:hypothetical protein